MRNPVEEKLKDLAHSYDASGLYLTPDGIELLEKDPNQIVDYLAASAKVMSEVVTPFQEKTFIHHGSYSHIYRLPEHDDKCIKVSGNHTKKQDHYPAPDLFTETKFMYLVEKHLANKASEKVYAPKQYGTLKFPNGMTALQSRIPSEFSDISSLMQNKDPQKRTLYRRQAEIAYWRATRALGDSLLRFGVGDMIGQLSMVNAGNFLIHPERLAHNGEVYVIDLVGPRKYETSLPVR